MSCHVTWKNHKPLIVMRYMSKALITWDRYELWPVRLRPVRLSLHEPGLKVWSDYMRPVRDLRSAWMFTWNMQEVPIFLLWSALLCLHIVKCSTANENTTESEEKRERLLRLFSAQKGKCKTREDGGLLQEGLIVGGSGKCGTKKACLQNGMGTSECRGSMLKTVISDRSQISSCLHGSVVRLQTGPSHSCRFSNRNDWNRHVMTSQTGFM